MLHLIGNISICTFCFGTDDTSTLSITYNKKNE